MAIGASCLPFEDLFAVCCRVAIEHSGRSFRGRQGQLVEVQRRQLRGDPILLVVLLSLLRACCDRVLVRVVESRIVEPAFAMHFEIADIGIPVADGTPCSGPGVVIDPGKTEGGRVEGGRRLAVRTEGLSVQVQLRVEFAWSPTGENLLYGRLVDLE